MRAIILLVLFTMAMPLSAAGILIVGDSISAAHGIDKQHGWVALLEQRVAQQCAPLPVHNASVSGETSAGGLNRLPALLLRHQPNIVVIELGGNDGLRGLSPQLLQRNLTDMVRLSQAAGAEVLLLGMLLPANYGEAFVNLFRQAFADTVKKSAVPSVAFFLEGVAAVPTLMQADGLHPTVAAQPQLLENAWIELAPLLAKYCHG